MGNANQNTGDEIVLYTEPADPGSVYSFMHAAGREAGLRAERL